MDPGGVGALIGISFMVCGVVLMKVYDVCQKKKTPLLVIKTNPTELPLLVRRQSKINTILPK